MESCHYSAPQRHAAQGAEGVPACQKRPVTLATLHGCKRRTMSSVRQAGTEMILGRLVFLTHHNQECQRVIPPITVMTQALGRKW